MGFSIENGVTTGTWYTLNAASENQIFSKADVDGGLIGGASLKSADFTAIVTASKS